MFSIIDVETTGTANHGSRVTEIAILCHDGQRVVESFQSLVNPQCWIPGFITQLTGISNQMVRDAPTFEEIADEVRRLTRDTVFVAHNVAFDYGFVQREFGRLDEYFHRDRLCTVQLSRKIFPGYKSYSLGNICRSLQIEHTDHHRAMGDASATVRLFERLLANDSKGILKKWTK
ncbi:MAG: 3'-5' exonuclease [Spirosomaceae bacterium]|jgi:DNA polymerase III subunit epsilon|nr:3'-5' exonuclease [Spirosomataceae bacterium]